ncbi:sulfatase [Luteolibacter algae]|uniref:Sulfatase n=1 Tax=Luteolibacter algae TaxID=454151 RepID=A0ABW5D9Q2_9BACT
MTVNKFIGACLLAAALNPLNAASEKKNILFLCVDDLRPELHSFGVDYIKSPNIDKLVAAGRAFDRHFVNSPSCGPSRFTMLTGRYGTAGNDAIFKRAERLRENPESVPPTMPEWFRKEGYTTVAIGKISHHPGGLGGSDWNDPDQVEIPDAWDKNLMPTGAWKHPRGSMHGLANGEIRSKNRGTMDVFQTVEGPDSIYPDGLITDEALTQLGQLAQQKEKPFFLAVGLIKPHLPFGAPKQYMDLYTGVDLPPIPHPGKPAGKTTWHGSGEFMGQYNRWGKDPRTDSDFATEVRRHYAACATYADAQIGRIIDKLKETGADQNTVIVLWGDHGWHLGEHSIWGKHALFEESLRSPLIIVDPAVIAPGTMSHSVVASIDIFPTLCDLTEIPKPDFLQGTSLLPQLKDPTAAGHAAVAYRGEAKTIRNATHRLTRHKSGEVELYDHTSSAAETKNIATDQPEIVEAMSKELSKILK